MVNSWSYDRNVYASLSWSGSYRKIFSQHSQSRCFGIRKTKNSREIIRMQNKIIAIIGRRILASLQNHVCDWKRDKSCVNYKMQWPRWPKLFSISGPSFMAGLYRYICDKNMNSGIIGWWWSYPPPLPKAPPQAPTPITNDRYPT